jgi:lysophospholipase L1-like esterase
MIYAALGDSITYGYSATSDEHTYVSRIQASLAKQQQPVNLYLHAKPGWTSRQLLKSLAKTPSCIWEEAKVITLLVGGNDMLRAAPWLLDSNPGHMVKVADAFYENITEIIQLVRRPHSVLILGTVYNPFPNSLMCEEYTDVLNRSIRLAAEREGAVLADIRRTFRNRESKLIEGYRRGQLRDMRLRGNPIHPNDAGHALIARQFLVAYHRSLAKKRGTRRKMRAR